MPWKCVSVKGAQKTCIKIGRVYLRPLANTHCEMPGLLKYMKISVGTRCSWNIANVNVPRYLCPVRNGVPVVCLRTTIILHDNYHAIF